MVGEDRIFHITTGDQWQAAQAAGEYRAESLDAQGFIHASTRGQVVDTANLVFRGLGGLVLLCIDESRISAPVKYEAPDGPGHREGGGLFPHIYGPLNLDAVTRVLEFPCGEDGMFVMPVEEHG